jgi:NAD(P)H-hydrate epimerase
MLPHFERLPTDVYAVAQVRAMDAAAIGDHGIAGYTLMERAADAALRVILQRWPAARGLRIYCGLGNNAGDGYVLARLAHAHAVAVTLVQCAAAEKLGGDAARAWADIAGADVAVSDFAGNAGPAKGEIVVDALFGTGLSRPLEGVFAAAVEQIAATPGAIIALDVPSGLDADTGLVNGPAVRAHCTIGFVGLKTGYFLGVGPDHCGQLEFADLDIPASVRELHRPVLRRLRVADIGTVLPRRSRLANKGDNGRLLVVGGGPGMPGAVRMAAEAALRSGVGLVYAATHPQNAAAIVAQRPEIIAFGVDSPADLAALQLEADAIVIGPGLGRSEWASALCEWALGAAVPLIVDADALNWLAARTGPVRQPEQWLLTPHPGEAGRLLGQSAADVQRDRLGAVSALSRRFGATTVLKGACTLTAEAGDAHVPGVCLAGNPGMASAGTGDVLAGVIGGIFAQCRDLRAAADTGVLVHGLAGDTAAELGERGLIATDLLTGIRRWVNVS